jgi:arylformamidase
MLIDISRELSEKTPVYPGDRPFSREFTSRLHEDGCNVTAVSGSSHAGTHVDFPLHAIEGSADPDLAVFVGPAVVIEVSDWPSVSLESHAPGSRVLFKTQETLQASVAEWLAAMPAALVGVEVSSVDPVGDSDLKNHKKLLGAGVCILENLDLSGVEPGEYELIALPLRIAGADASWVRAVLRR